MWRACEKPLARDRRPRAYAQHGVESVCERGVICCVWSSLLARLVRRWHVAWRGGGLEINQIAFTLCPIQDSVNRCASEKPK